MEQQIETNHSDQMETSSFVTDQFLTPVRNLIGYAIEAVQHGSIKTQKKIKIKKISFLCICRARCCNHADLFVQ